MRSVNAQNRKPNPDKCGCINMCGNMLTHARRQLQDIAFFAEAAGAPEEGPCVWLPADCNELAAGTSVTDASPRSNNVAAPFLECVIVLLPFCVALLFLLNSQFSVSWFTHSGLWIIL